jgi:DNA repair exonuclease SbcCD nuclease subunit
VKLLIFSDAHADATTAGYDRSEDVAGALGEVVRAAVKEDVDLVLFLGDLCDPDGSRSHRAAALGTFTACTLWFQHGIRSRWLVGNHDVIEDGSGSHTLAGVAAVEASQQGRGARMGGEAIKVYSEPTSERFGDRREGGFDLVALPFTPRSHAYDPQLFVEHHNLGGVGENGWPVVVIAHLNIEGIAPGSETIDMPRGRAVFLPVDAIRKRWPKALVVAGHYHQRQVFDGVVVVGSLERLTFGEERNAPGWLIVEV